MIVARSNKGLSEVSKLATSEPELLFAHSGTGRLLNARDHDVQMQLEPSGPGQPFREQLYLRAADNLHRKATWLMAGSRAQMQQGSACARSGLQAARLSIATLPTRLVPGPDSRLAPSSITV